MNSDGKFCASNRRILPPKGLLFSLLIQVPTLLWCWPPHPSVSAVLAGIGTLLMGVILNLWANSLFVKKKVGVCPFSPVGSLLSEGPFRFTRNPMYLGMVLICAGMALVTGLYFNLCAAALLAVWLHFRFVLPEEEFLEEQMGLDYLTYARRSPRWLGLPGPRIVQLNPTGTTTQHPF
jgi:protein-S-isoprenylcysteine O-methyltransferase Ste14